MQQLPYRLEVAVRRVYGLSPLIASTASKIAVEVRFLDFPAIVIHPQGLAVGDAVAYNVCHKADFRMTAEQAANVFPAVCQCNLSAESDPSLAATARWACPCSLVSGGDAAPSTQRTFVNCVLRSSAGETLGYAEMCCSVVALFASPLPQQPAGPAAAARQAAFPASMSVAAPPPPPSQSPPPAADTSQRPSPDAEHGKPYIVRVVVGESDRRRHSGRDTGAAVANRDVGAARSGSQRSSPVHHASANTASKESLLYVLQYDVAYQLQSLSETTAAALRREHTALSGTPLSSASKDTGVTIPKLTKSIDRSVAQMVKLANIILQVANQLVDNSPAPSRTGGSREIKDLARQRRNPVNALPVPAAQSVGHYLQYDVLYQLQCLGTNLGYVTLAYREALDVPLSALPKQHVEFCASLGDEVQHLTRLLNILVQSSVDGAFSAATAPSPADDKPKKSKSKHRDAAAAAAKAKPPAQTLSISEIKTSRSSSSSSFTSLTDSSSSSGSSLSSSDSSLNRPPQTPNRAAPPTAAMVVPAAVPPPNPVVPSLPSLPLQPAPQSYATPVAPVAPQPQVSPPPYATVAASSPPQPLLSPTESRPREESHSFLSVPGATPFSWVNAMGNERHDTSLPSAPSVPSTPPTSGVYNTAGTGFAPQPVVAPPALSAPQLSIVPPQLSLPSPQTPPATLPPPPPTSWQPPPPSLAPAPIPIPVPIPR